MIRLMGAARLFAPWVAALALALALQPALAQQPATDKGTQSADSSSDEPALQPADKGSAADQGSQPPRSSNTDSPFDYKASEKISEDLSVSFPVDI